MEYSYFIPQFGNFIITLLAFILSLSLIVFVHEFGHYFMGKLSGIHAEIFSIGFGPVLISKLDKNGTKWQIAALPFGGFVKFLGDNSSFDNPNLKPKFENNVGYIRSTMHGAPLWARITTVAAGPFFNFIFSVCIFFLIYMGQGVIEMPLTVNKLFDSPYEQKLKQGDIIRSINGVLVEGELNEAASFEESSSFDGSNYVVERDGQLITLENVVHSPPRISQVLPKSAAIMAGLEKGDLIISVNSQQIFTFNQIKQVVEASEGRALEVAYWRKGVFKNTQLLPLIVDVPTETGGFERTYRIGIVSDYLPFEPVTKNQSVAIALINSFQSIYLIMEGSVKGIYHILFGNISSCNLSGPITIAETSGQMVKQGGLNYLWFLAVLSTAIGMINLFPIPALDGGHLVFFAFEAVLGRKPNPNIINKFMTFGFFLLIGLMLFSIFNDFVCP